ncbi:MAG: polysaccharide deacetylase family protein [Dehalococcoidia bacterium]|nr:polysaccharide deacetylase family protein [Dehalococcoidia bacterium]
MTRYRWPDGKQSAVVLSWHVDAESGHEYRDPQSAATQLGDMEERRYGPRVAVPRILRLLDRRGIPASFCVPGYTVRHHTAVVKSIQAAGHELACHGDVHEDIHPLDEEAERDLLQRQLGIFEEHLGIRPRGYSSPFWSMNLRTPRLLKEEGFIYDNSLMGDDTPYFLETRHGELVEIPVQWLLDDAPFYRHVYGASNAMADPDRVVGQWTQEFRGMHRENGCFVLTMHPWISGRTSRLDGLERLLDVIQEEPGVWFTTAMQVAEWAISTQQNKEVKVRGLPD